MRYLLPLLLLATPAAAQNYGAGWGADLPVTYTDPGSLRAEREIAQEHCTYGTGPCERPVIIDIVMTRDKPKVKR